MTSPGVGESASPRQAGCTGRTPGAVEPPRRSLRRCRRRAPGSPRTACGASWPDGSSWRSRSRVVDVAAAVGIGGGRRGGARRRVRGRRGRRGGDERGVRRPAAWDRPQVGRSVRRRRARPRRRARGPGGGRSGACGRRPGPRRGAAGARPVRTAARAPRRLGAQPVRGRCCGAGSVRSRWLGRRPGSTVAFSGERAINSVTSSRSSGELEVRGTVIDSRSASPRPGPA